MNNYNMFKGHHKKKKKFQIDFFKVTRLAGLVAVASTFAFHQFVATATREHLWLARGLSLGATICLGFYELFIYRREMARRNKEKTIREEENIKAIVRSELKAKANSSTQKTSSRLAVDSNYPLQPPAKNNED